MANHIDEYISTFFAAEPHRYVTEKRGAEANQLRGPVPPRRVHGRSLAGVPFRLSLTILHLRKVVYPDAAERDKFARLASVSSTTSKMLAVRLVTTKCGANFSR